MRRIRLIPYSLFLIPLLLFASPAYAQEVNMADDVIVVEEVHVPAAEENTETAVAAEAEEWDPEKEFGGNLSELIRDIDRLDAGFSARIIGTDGQLRRQFLPPEARIGRALIGGLNRIAVVINNSLAGFVSVLLLVLFAFWMMMETYHVMMTGGDMKKLAYEIVRKGMWISIWFIILNSNPTELFLLAATPVIRAGTFMSDAILGAVTAAGGVPLHDTCGAIHEYMAANPIPGMLVNSEVAADMLCMPTRLSGFFWTCIAAGIRFMAGSAAISVIPGFRAGGAIMFVIGAVFLWIFLINVWKFAVKALGVVTSLFLALMFLPFTAIAECFDGGKTSLKDQGLLSTFFGMLAKMLGGDKFRLWGQFMIFVNAAIYFVVLSIVAAIGLAIINVVVPRGVAVTALGLDGLAMLVVAGLLVSHLANKADDIAKDLGGTIDDEFGKQIKKDAETVWENTKKLAKAVAKPKGNNS